MLCVNASPHFTYQNTNYPDSNGQLNQCRKNIRHLMSNVDPIETRANASCTMSSCFRWADVRLPTFLLRMAMYPISGQCIRYWANVCSIEVYSEIGQFLHWANVEFFKRLRADTCAPGDVSDIGPMTVRLKFTQKFISFCIEPTSNFSNDLACGYTYYYTYCRQVS